MLLSLLSSSRHFRTLLIVGSLILGLARQSFCAVLASPTLVSVTNGACTSATLTWSNTGTSTYFVMVLLNGSPVMIQNVTGTSYTFNGLTAGANYSVMIQAIAEQPTDMNSGFSAPMPFAVTCGPVCTAPAVTLAQPKPAVLCIGHDKMIPVVFAGSVTSLCSVTGAQYTLTDSMGSTSHGSVSVASDGSFAVTLTLAAKFPGRRYVFSTQATNSVGSMTSDPVILSVQRGCGELADSDRDDRHHHHHDLDED